MTFEDWLKDFEIAMQAKYQNAQRRVVTKAEREREIQFGAGNEHAQWWVEQNRLDAMRRGE
jgi:hypothetical protein